MRDRCSETAAVSRVPPGGSHAHSQLPVWVPWLDRLRDCESVTEPRVLALIFHGLMAPDEVVQDVDASLVDIHSENKEKAAANYEGGYGFHLLCFLDAPAARHWPVSSGRATPRPTPVSTCWRESMRPRRRRRCQRGGSFRGRSCLSTDTAGAVASLIDDGLVARNCEFSIGSATPSMQPSPPFMPGPAADANGGHRRGAQIARSVALAAWPAGTRAICRREKPPRRSAAAAVGPQPSAVTDIPRGLHLVMRTGLRHQVADQLGRQRRGLGVAPPPPCRGRKPDQEPEGLRFGPDAVHQLRGECGVNGAHLGRRTYWRGARCFCVDGELTGPSPGPCATACCITRAPRAQSRRGRPAPSQTLAVDLGARRR